MSATQTQTLIACATCDWVGSQWEAKTEVIALLTPGERMPGEYKVLVCPQCKSVL